MMARWKRLVAAALVAGLGAATPVAAQMSGGGHGHGADGTGHDMARMPGLQGENASPEESAEIALLFRAFRTLSREVELLPDGIRTVTRSSDPEVMDVLVSHVAGMIGRVEDLDDPKIRIQSPTLDIFFLRGDQIESSVDVGVQGVVVEQRSADPEVVAALQAHAQEVTEMVEMGMHAVHMRMMRQGH